MRSGYALLFGLASASALAAEGDRHHGLGARAGTTGFVLDYGLPLQERLNLRVGYHRGHYQWDQEKGDIDYDGKLQMEAFAALLDWRPFAGGFRVSLGGFSSTPEMALRSGGRDDYRIGSRRYTADLDLRGDVDMGGAAPYLGIGWGSAGGPGWGFSADLGVLFGQAPAFDLVVRGRACDSTLFPCDPNGPTSFDVNGNSPEAQRFQRDRDQEVEEVEDDLRAYRFWPVLMLGLEYRF